MKHFFIAFLLFSCMNACSYGQDRSFPTTRTQQGSLLNDPDIYKISIALTAIKRLYVDTVNSNQLTEDAIIYMLEKLDPHSAYMSAEEVREPNDQLQGNFDGIGIQFNMLTDTLYVIQVIAGGPSEKVGILAGDKIIFVDDTLIAGVKMKNTDIISKLKGPKGTTVNVKILRKGFTKLLDFKIVRDRIPVFSISSSYMIDNKTGYIQIDRFARTTHQEFIDSLKILKAQGMENLILDLQENSGGILESAVDLSNEFLNPGSLIVYTEGLNQRRDNWRSTSNGSFQKGRLIILVNEYSASASEIVAGAVQDWDRGVIVGRRTYGKGLVQRPINLPDGSMIRLTTAHYYTPTGRSIQKPYTVGDRESYHKDLYDRYNKGEMISADSIHFPDSLKYSTLTNKRTVYGGGGIMPDYYVPVDTTSTIYAALSTPLYKEIVYKNFLVRYVRNNIEANRDRYKKQYPNFDSFKKNFTVSDNMLNELLNIYKKDKAEELNETAYQLTAEQQKEFEKSKFLLSQWIKMLIAREIFGENEFYQLRNPYFMDSYNKAIEIISDENEYNKLLSQGRK